MPCTNWLAWTLVEFPRKDLLDKAVEQVFPGQTAESLGFVLKDGKYVWDNYSVSPSAKRLIQRIGVNEFSRQMKVQYTEATIAAIKGKVRGKVAKRRQVGREVVVTIRY